MGKQTFDEFLAAERGTATGFTTAAGDSSNLTFEKLMATIEDFRKPKLYKPKLYYAFCEFIPQGDVYWIEENDLFPLRMVIHPDDFERIKDELSLYRTLIPLADYRQAVTTLRPMRNRVW